TALRPGCPALARPIDRLGGGRCRVPREADAPVQRPMSMAHETPLAAGDAARRAGEAVESLYLADLRSKSRGIEIIGVAPGGVPLPMTVRPDMVNGYGMCHGGIVFAFADSAFA